ncbi:amino acid permease [Micrococcales bacterium 31B]|nr:amino acid permease [Micrococcales bacterium 31B]
MADSAENSRRLKARDTVAMCTPTLSVVFVVTGSTAGALGVWGAAIVCFTLALVSYLQNFLFAEMASMFPDKSGGVALFAAESWKKFSPLVASIASFGYWCGWGLALSLASMQIGKILVTQWLPGLDFTLSLGFVSVGAPQLLGILALAAAIGVNLTGLKVTVNLNKVVSAAVVAVLLGLCILPFFATDWSTRTFTLNLLGPDTGWLTILVWMYVGAWSIYASELCATFAPKYHQPVRDTNRALRSMALIFIVVFSLVPIASAGALGEQGIVTDPVNYGLNFYRETFGDAVGSVVTLVLLVAHGAALLSAAADASHALKGLADEKLTIRQLAHVNRRGAPAGALIFTLVANVLMLIVVKTPVAIVIAANLGYMLSVTLACGGFIVMRKTHAHVARPMRLGAHWIPIAVLLTAFNLAILLAGAFNPGLAAGGGGAEIMIASGLLLLGGIFYLLGVAQQRGRSGGGAGTGGAVGAGSGDSGATSAPVAGTRTAS